MGKVSESIWSNVVTYKEAEEMARNAAEEAVRLYKISQLPDQQKKIFNSLSTSFFTTGQIAKNVDIPSKNVSVQLMKILKVGDLIEVDQTGKRKRWKLIHIPDFWVECGVCKTKLKNWVGSTPCCGSVAYVVDDNGNTTTEMVLFGKIVQKLES